MWAGTLPNKVDKEIKGMDGMTSLTKAFLPQKSKMLMINFWLTATT